MPFSEQKVLALARQAYREGEARFEIEAQRAALLVIDMQDEFVRPGWSPYWVPDATRQVPRIQRLIDKCRQVGVPVIFTVVAGTHLYRDRPRSGALMPNRFPEISQNPSWFRDGRVWHELQPRPDEIVIFKSSYGAFYDTPLETVLRNLERDTVIISGTLTNFCCGTTARQAYERGFLVVFGSDVTATDVPELQEPELAVLRKGFARVLTCDEILSHLHRPPDGRNRSQSHATQARSLPLVDTQSSADDENECDHGAPG
jgi:nicotinamidase-related amidase